MITILKCQTIMKNIVVKERILYIHTINRTHGTLMYIHQYILYHKKHSEAFFSLRLI